MSEDNQTPEQALAAIREARAQVGRSLDYPIAWDFLFGLIIFAMVAGQGLPQQYSMLVVGPSLIGLFWMMKWWRDRFGWWVNGYAPKKARWVAYLLAALMMACMGFALWTRFWDGPWWAALVGGLVAGLGSIPLGRWWMAVYRKEMEEGDL